MNPAIYILANRINGTLYTGVTSNLVQRIWQHRNGQQSDFASRYGCYRLVHYELCDSMEAAIAREKQIKGGSRQKKVDLIGRGNPRWVDLFGDLLR